MCKNHLSVKIVVHICFWCVKVSVRKRFCCVKTVLGNLFVCTSFSVLNVYCVEKTCVKKNVQRFLCAKGSVCKNAYVPLFMRAKKCLHKECVCKIFRLCLKTSVCKGVFVQKFFVFFAQKPFCVRIFARKNCSV